jgi:SAM-dependent methyltransferase
MVDEGRWERAQHSEAAYWRRRAARGTKSGAPLLAFYQWRAEQLVARLDRLGLGELASGSADVLEVGSGPVGIVSFFPGKRLVAVDPLADTYALDPALVERRNPSTEYRQAMGEALPFPGASFDLVIIENCIDHVRDAAGVMDELYRVIRPDGILYLTVNCRSASGYYMHRFLSRTGLDPAHPHTFTPERIRRLIERHRFEMLDIEAFKSYREARREDWQSMERKLRIKALLGVSEYAVGLVARRATAESSQSGLTSG